jgi:hypothetical protein
LRLEEKIYQHPRHRPMTVLERKALRPKLADLGLTDDGPSSTPSGLSALREAVVQPVPVSGRSINWCRFDGALAKDETMTN